jgi:hypothetical protein
VRPVNLVPGEFRARGAGDGDPKVAYGVVGGLGLLLVMVLLAIVQSNKATTLQDETAALQAEAQRHQVRAKPVQSFNDFADDVKKRTLLIGGLAASRFPWDKALRNLSESTPGDVTLDSVAATTAGETGQPTGDAATIQLAGCSSDWIGLSRFIVRLREMPGVSKVVSSNGSVNPEASGDSNAGAAGGDDRKANCGKKPLTFQIAVTFAPRKIDLTGLPKIAAPAAAGGATGATGATAAAPAPAAATGTGG